MKSSFPPIFLSNPNSLPYIGENKNTIYMSVFIKKYSQNITTIQQKKAKLKYSNKLNLK